MNIRKKVSVIFTAIMLCNLLSIQALTQVVKANSDSTKSILFVSTEGKDSNKGTIDSPFATLEKARDEIRNIKNTSGLPQGGITVFLRGGEYSRLNTFELGEQDSGTVDAPISYRAYADEKVILTGGKTISAKSMQQITDQSIIDKLPTESKNKVVVVDLSAIGITKEQLGRLNYPGAYSSYINGNDSGHKFYPEFPLASELYMNDSVMKLARYPNEGFITIEEVVHQGALPGYWMADLKNDPSYIKPEDRDPNDTFIIRNNDIRIQRWTQANQARMYGYWAYGWADQTVDIKEIDVRQKTISSKQPSCWAITTNGEHGGSYYFVYNLIEEIDTPGEYFIDRDNDKLYFYPTSSIESSRIELSILDKPMLQMTKVSNVKFSNFVMTTMRDKAVIVSDGENNLISNCIIKNAGGKTKTDGCVSISGKNHGIVSCEIFNTDGGIVLSGGDRNTLTPGDNYAENNKIHNWGRINTMYNYAITLNGVGNRASHNEIYNHKHNAIIFNGNEHIVEYNEIYDVLKNTTDAAAIYVGFDWSARGNKVRNNYIHDIKSNLDGLLFAIYLDGNFSSAEITGNVVARFTQHTFEGKQTAGFMIGGGRDNIIKNNIFIDPSEDASFLATQHWDNGYNHLAPGGWLYRNLEASPYRSDLWRQRYPSLYNILDSNPALPVGNIVKDNVNINVKKRHIGNELFSTHSQISEAIDVTVDEAKFVDYANDNFTLKSDSAIFTKIPGFKSIEFEKMGRYTDKIKEKIKDAVALYIGSPNAYVKNERKLVDDKNFEVMPLIKDSRTLVPVRFIAESFGADVGWNGATSEITVTLKDKTIKMALGSNKISVNGQESTLDVPAQSINGRTLIPLRALVESIGKKVFWDSKGLIIISDMDEIFDNTSDSTLIDEIIRQLTIR